MIDIESDVFSKISEKVRTKYPDIYVTGEYVKSPSSFPCVSLVENDNQCYQKSQTTDSVENHVSVLYEVNVYSNKTKGKKTECKTIIAIIDSEFAKLGFTRIMLNPIPNEIDATIYRMLGRYRAIISKNNVIYRR